MSFRSDFIGFFCYRHNAERLDSEAMMCNDPLKGRWPLPGDRPFMTSKSRDTEHLNSYVGWYRGSDPAISYREAAERLSSTAVGDSFGTDVLFRPIAFLWRQYLELRLKSIIITGARLSKAEEQEAPATHDLLFLWREAVSILKDKHPTSVEYRCVEIIIRDFVSVDPKGDGFRYAKTRKGASHLNKAPDLVSLKNLHEVMAGCANFLDAAESDLLAALNDVEDAY